MPGAAVAGPTFKSYETVKTNNEKNNVENQVVMKTTTSKEEPPHVVDERCGVHKDLLKSTTLSAYMNRVTPSPTLLCAYEYFLNEDQNKTISIGYNPEDGFKALFVMRSYAEKTYPNFITFTFMDFKRLFCSKVEDFFNPLTILSHYYDKSNPVEREAYERAVKELEDEINIKAVNGYSDHLLDTANMSFYKKYSSESTEPILSITGWNSHSNDYIELTKKEVQNLKTLYDFFETMWVNIRSSSYEAQLYYWEYVKLCNQKKLEILPEALYFTPNIHKPAIFNCFRLFNEIPIYCRRKLHQDLALFIKSSDQNNNKQL